MSKLIYYVYVIFHPITAVPFYIGKGKGSRWQCHLKNSHNRRVRRLITKYGDAPIVIIRDKITNDEAFLTETAFITAIGRKDKNLGPLVNLTDGGDGVVNPSEKTRQIIGNYIFDSLNRNRYNPPINRGLWQ